MSTRKRHGGRTQDASATTSATTRSRKRRARPLPKWLSGSSDLDAIAQRRCLMILSVLSGERPVSDVIEQLSISRGTYYQLEERALAAMLAALVPGSSESASDPTATSPARRITELEDKVRRLERDKRRMERLLFLTRKLVRQGPVTTSAGRRKKRRPARASTPGGSSVSPSSPTTTTESSSRSTTTLPSTPSSDGAAER